MRVVIAPDKFRGCLSAEAACRAIARGVAAGDPDATWDLVPMADGGEGTLDALVAATGGDLRTAEVVGPLGNPVVARWGVLGDGRTAVVEAAEAVGHARNPPGGRDVMRASTFGVGQLIRLAFDAGYTPVTVAVGGTVTMDGGVGMAQALGFRFLDRDGREIGPGGGALADLATIDASAADPRLRHSVHIDVAADVLNPLCGPNGAAHVYGPQKGASPEQVATLDRNLAHLAAIIRRDLHADERSGRATKFADAGGAAGGLAAGLVALADARLWSGARLVSLTVDLGARLHRADLCLTGEGCLDGSTASGKTVACVAQEAHAYRVPVVALAGTIRPEAACLHDLGLTASFAICPGPVMLDEALANADLWLAHAAEQVVRLALKHRGGPGFASTDPNPWFDHP